MSWDQIESKWLAMTRRVRAGEAVSEITRGGTAKGDVGKDVAVGLPLVTKLPTPSVSDQAEPQQ